MASWIHKGDAPFLMYFHVWELDPDQPRIQGVPLSQRVRQYRNLHKMRELIEYYLERYSFVSIADHLGLFKGKTREVVREFKRDESSGVHFDGPRLPVTIVIPCFNEELILPYLANTLKSVRRALADRYDIRFVFVDDGSRDETWSSLEKLFGDRADCNFVRHDTNKGVASAILTGLEAADTEVVCSIDCDCTYDPHQLEQLIPLLTEGVDMVTASPYHKDGIVRNVPGWRLFLSRSLSRLYRVVLNHRLATYTSCFRVYRRSALNEFILREGGFLGVAEMIGRLDLSGGKIVECPAVLEVRLLGHSKMKTIRTIFGHLRLLLRLGYARLMATEQGQGEREAVGKAAASTMGSKKNSVSNHQ